MPLLIAAGVLLSSAPPATAQGLAVVSTPSSLSLPAGPAPLALPDAIRRALASNPDLSAVRREWEATAGGLLQAGLRPNPVASAYEEDLRRGRRVSTLQLTQPIELGGKRAARIEVASRVRDQAALGIEQYRADIRAAVVDGYFEVLIAEERLRLAQESLALSAGSADAAGKRVAAGKISPVEETRARVAQAAAQADLARAAGDLRVARQRLSTLWGDQEPVYGALAGTLVLPAEGLADEFVYRRQQASPTLRRARAEVERWRSSVDLERARGVVDVSVTVGTRRVQEAGSTQAVLGVSVPLPLFDRNQGNLAEALSRLDKAQDELAATELRLGAQIAQAREQLRAARSEALTLERDAVPGARSAFRAASQGFGLGKFSYLETLDAQRTLVGTQAQYLRALSDTYRSATELERLLGLADESSPLLDAATPVAPATTVPTAHSATTRVLP